MASTLWRSADSLSTIAGYMKSPLSTFQPRRRISRIVVGGPAGNDLWRQSICSSRMRSSSSDPAFEVQATLGAQLRERRARLHHAAVLHGERLQARPVQLGRVGRDG